MERPLSSREAVLLLSFIFHNKALGGTALLVDSTGGGSLTR